MVEYRRTLDTTFGALADPTRRAIVSALSEREASVTALAEPFDVSLQAVSKHIGVLAGAGLVTRDKRGRVQWCRLTPEPLQEAEEWLGSYRHFWERQLDALDSYLARGRRR